MKAQKQTEVSDEPTWKQFSLGSYGGLKVPKLNKKKYIIIIIII